MLTPDSLLILVCAAAMGGFVIGIAGFGGAPMILSICLLVIEPTVAAPGLMIAGVVFLLTALWFVRQN